METRFRQLLVIAGLLLLGLVVLAGCGGSGGTPSSRDGATEEAELSTGAGSDEEAKTEPARFEVGRIGALPTTSPNLAPIGAGLDGIEGLEAKLFAEGLPSIEFLTPGPGKGEYFAATLASTADKKGASHLYLLKEGAKPVTLLKNQKPIFGILWNDDQLYVSTPGEVLAYSGFNGKSFASHRPVLNHLPANEIGWNGDIKAGPDGRLYMTIASSCDHCKPKNKLSATIVSFEPDGSDLKTVATGLRGNAYIGFTPRSNLLIAVSNQRDDMPIKDEMVLVQEGDDFGFPTCIRHSGSEASCKGFAKPLAELDAHGAPNGIAFVEGEWGAATEGLSAISTEWALGKVLQTAIVEEGDVVTAEPQQIIGGLKNTSSVVKSPDKDTVLIADYGTGKVYAITERRRRGTAPAQPESEASSEEQALGAPPAQGNLKPESKLMVEADPSGGLMFTKRTLTAEAGDVEVALVNKSPVPHDVVIEMGGKLIGETKVIAEGADSTVLELKLGTYTFFCSVPRHREAGMEGKLVVK